MYKCVSCGAILAEGEFEFVTETHGLSSPPYESIAVCPYCGSDDHEEYYGENDEEEEDE